MPPSNEEALFALALSKPAAERAAWLDRECGGDSALRQRLDALLAAHEQPDTLLATKAEAARPTIKLDLADAPDEAVGQTLGRYKLLERVGEGGCGVVYVAEQTEPVRRRVALKVIKLGMDTKQVVARFEAERQAPARPGASGAGWSMRRVPRCRQRIHLHGEHFWNLCRAPCWRHARCGRGQQAGRERSLHPGHLGQPPLRPQRQPPLGVR